MDTEFSKLDAVPLGLPFAGSFMYIFRHADLHNCLLYIEIFLITKCLTDLNIQDFPYMEEK